jgi:cysteine desulfurase / selenocysteine lyase
LLRKTDRGELGIYFDNAATTFKPQSVIDAVMRYYTEGSVNIHRGEYDLSYACRKPTMTHGPKWPASSTPITTSDHFHLRRHGFDESGGDGVRGSGASTGDVILTLESEHASSLLPLMRAAQSDRRTHRVHSTFGKVVVSISTRIKAALHDRVKLVAVAHVSNVLGYILPIADMARLAHAVGAVIAVDGAQSVPHLATDVTGLGS